MTHHDPIYDNWAGKLIRRARQARGLSLRALADKAGTSHPTLTAYEKGRKKPTADTLHRILWTCGFVADLTLRRRVREQNGLDRGTELVTALELAAQFPVRHATTWKAPIFHKENVSSD